MALYTHPAPVRSCDTETAVPKAIGRSIRTAGSAVRRFADAFSESCRRIRAYNELANLKPRALRDIGRWRDELDRVIAGEVPRRDRHEPFAGADRTDIPDARSPMVEQPTDSSSLDPRARAKRGPRTGLTSG